MARKMKTMDGNHAAAHASYAYSDVAARTRFHSYIIIKARHKRSAPAIIPLILESFII